MRLVINQPTPICAGYVPSNDDLARSYVEFIEPTDIKPCSLSPCLDESTKLVAFQASKILIVRTIPLPSYGNDTRQKGTRYLYSFACTREPPEFPEVLIPPFRMVATICGSISCR